MTRQCKSSRGCWSENVTNQAVEQVALSRAWVLERLMRHAQVCLGEIPLRLKMRKAHSADVVELETHQPDASAANRALELLGRELNLFSEKKEVGKPGEFDHLSDDELMKWIESQSEAVRELERQLLPPPGKRHTLCNECLIVYVSIMMHEDREWFEKEVEASRATSTATQAKAGGDCPCDWNGKRGSSQLLALWPWWFPQGGSYRLGIYVTCTPNPNAYCSRFALLCRSWLGTSRRADHLASSLLALELHATSWSTCGSKENVCPLADHHLADRCLARLLERLSKTLARHRGRY
jgi:hypothetical protein